MHKKNIKDNEKLKRKLPSPFSGKKKYCEQNRISKKIKTKQWVKLKMTSSNFKNKKANKKQKKTPKQKGTLVVVMKGGVNKKVRGI